MLKFTSERDLSSLPPDDPSRTLIADLIQHLITDTLTTDHPYVPDADGFIALVEPDDIGEPLTTIWPDTEVTLTSVPWEGITYRDGHYLAIYLANNQYGIVFVIPDEDWLGDELTNYLEDHLDPPLTGDNYDIDTKEGLAEEDSDGQEEISAEKESPADDSHY